MLCGMRRVLMGAAVVLALAGCADAAPVYCDETGNAVCDQSGGRTSLAFCRDGSGEIVAFASCEYDDAIDAFDVAPCADGSQLFCPDID